MSQVKKYLGKVYLVGAGPGDPGLMTLRGKTLLEHADVVVYDALVSPAILGMIASQAEKLMQENAEVVILSYKQKLLIY